MLLTKDDFKIGQEVACKHVGNLARRNSGMTLGTVVKVGRKFITVSFNSEGRNPVKFTLEEVIRKRLSITKF